MSRDFLYFFIAVLILLSIIVFEGFQQNYYITRFDLVDSGQFTLLRLIQNHFLRWVLWALTALPFYLYVKSKADEDIQTLDLLKYLIFIISIVLLDILLVSIAAALNNDVDLTGNTFLNYFEFFTFQKAPIFTLALVGLGVYTHLYFRNRVLALKIESLNSIKEMDNQLYNQLKENSWTDETRVISVKIGKRMKIIPLDEIVWVESDNYCVKIHSRDDRTYTLRSSMNKMEEILPESVFVRIHRTAIVSISDVSEVITGKRPSIILKKGESVEVAQSRISQVRKIFKNLNQNA